MDHTKFALQTHILTTKRAEQAKLLLLHNMQGQPAPLTPIVPQCWSHHTQGYLGIPNLPLRKTIYFYNHTGAILPF